MIFPVQINNYFSMFSMFWLVNLYLQIGELNHTKPGTFYLSTNQDFYFFMFVFNLVYLKWQINRIMEYGYNIFQSSAVVRTQSFKFSDFRTLTV